MVRKRIVNFLEKTLDYLGYDFRHDLYKKVVYNEERYITPFEEKAKHYIDAYKYLLSNTENALTSNVIKRFIYLIKGIELPMSNLERISSYYFYLQNEDELMKAVKLHLFVYKELSFLEYEERMIISLMFFNYVLVKQNIPCIQILKNELPEYEKIRDEDNVSKLYIYMKEIVKNNKFQDEKYYLNLKRITSDDVKQKILKKKDKLINEYKIKSIYIFGSFCRSEERIDSDIDIAVEISLDLTKEEKEKTLEELKKYFYKIFKRFIDIHELMDIVKEDFIKKAKNIIKIY